MGWRGARPEPALDLYHAALDRLQLDGEVVSLRLFATRDCRLRYRPRRWTVGWCIPEPVAGLADGRAARAWRMRVPDQ
jgi:hypothetical protein